MTAELAMVGSRLGGMGRQQAIEQIEAARREATRRRLIGLGVQESTADAWIEAWANQAAVDGVRPGGGYWDACWRWIEAQRQLRTRP